MNVVAMRPLPGPTAAPGSARLARVEIFRELAAAEPHWRALERGNALTTPYQHFDFLSLWQRHMGSPARVSPFVVVGFDAGGVPIFLWPFGRRSIGGLRAIEFLGGKHANFNVALWRRDAAAAITRADIDGVLEQLKADADALLLVNQPLTWQGTTNPMAQAPHRGSPNMGHSGALTRDFDTLLRARTNAPTRKKIRKKAQTLASFGAVRFERAADDTAARRVLDAFFKQKSARMRTQGLRDVFATPDVRRFIEEAAAGSSPVVELYSLSVDDIIVATMGGIAGGGRFCAMFNSIIPARFAAESPGEQLILHLVRHCCGRGLDTFDLGVGEARYKNLLCGDAEPLFDTFIALTPAGRTLTGWARAKGALKRAVKHNPLLWSAVGAVRKWRAVFSR